MKYRAKATGFVGGCRVRAGDVFEFEGKPGKWMEPVKESEKVTAAKPAKKEAPKEQKEPETFGEMAKRDSKVQAGSKDVTGESPSTKPAK